MRKKCGFWVLALGLFAFFVFLNPSLAVADTMQTNGVNVGSPGTPIGNLPPPTTPLCPGAASYGNGLDNAARTNSSAFQQSLFIAMDNVQQQFTVVPSMNACLTNLLNIFNELPSLTDPFGIVGSTISSLINGLIGQVCSQVMGMITSIQNSLVNAFKICLPIPSFGGIDLPQFNISGCSGGMTLNFLGGFGAPASSALYNYTQYLQ